MSLAEKTAPAPPALVHASSVNSYDLAAIRADFPILSRSVHGKPLVYLDNAASAQKPRQVIEAMTGLMQERYANVHRGLHFLSGAATDAMEAARETVRAHLNAGSVEEIIFTKNATEALNLVASSFGGEVLGDGDEVLLTVLEHHSNIIPWQLLRRRTGCVLRYAPIDETGALDMAAFAASIGPRTKMIAVTHMSNALGTLLPAAEIVALAKTHGIPVLLDGSQAVVHGKVDVRALECDFYVFTGHKLYGPSGIGVLYGKRDRLAAMPPYQGGGEMIATVGEQESSWADLPFKFEAGTPPIVEAVGLGAAIDYVNGIGLERIAAHETDLLRYAEERLLAVPGVTIVGRAPHKAGVLSFTMDCAHPHDIGTLVDRAGVAIRAGHHCAQPLMERLDLPGTARASFGLYNSRAEVDALAEALDTVRRMLG